MFSLQDDTEGRRTKAVAAASASFPPLAKPLQDDVIAVTQHEAIIVRTFKLQQCAC